MKICIAGWYFREAYLKAVRSSKYEAMVIKHREGNAHGVGSMLHPNVGLEFGAYRQYVENYWDYESDVFFSHDDVDVSSLTAFSDVASLKDMGVEQAYIFQDETHEYVNGGCHGRGIWIRGDILRQLVSAFPADMENEGVNIGVVAQKGAIQFHKRIMECGKNTGVIAIVPQFRFAHRGRLHDQMFVYRPTTPIPGGLVAVNE